jgi:hypothetical protein
MRQAHIGSLYSVHHSGSQAREKNLLTGKRKTLIRGKNKSSHGGDEIRIYLESVTCFLNG